MPGGGQSVIGATSRADILRRAPADGAGVVSGGNQAAKEAHEAKQQAEANAEAQAEAQRRSARLR